MKKKLCAIMLAVCVAGSSVPMTAWAKEPDEMESKQQTEEMGEDADSLGKEEGETDFYPESEKEPEEAFLIKEVLPEEEEENDVKSASESDDEKKNVITEKPDENTKEENPGSEETEVSQTPAAKEKTGSLMPLKVIELSEEDCARTEILDPDQIQNGRSVYGSAKYHTGWDTYSSNYIYNRLNNAERKVWDGLDNITRSYLLSNTNAQTYQYSDGTVSGLPKETVDYGSMKSERAADIAMMFIYANPQYYFLDGSFFWNEGRHILTLGFYEKFIKGSERRAQTNQLKNQVDTWEAEIAQEPTEVLKAKKAHDLIIEKVEYDNFYQSDLLADNPFHQSAYSVFCDDHTVCAGYTKAFELLMNGAGVDAMAVTSTDHAWNIININDSWYYTDLTWDDEYQENGIPMPYKHFNRSRDVMTSLGHHTAEFMYVDLLPKCTLDSGGGYDNVHTPTRTTDAPSVSLKAVSRGVEVTLKSPTSGAEIYYTLNGENPSSNYTRSYLYKGKFVVPSKATVKAVAVRDKYWDSAVTSKSTGKSCKITFKTNGGSSISTKYILSGSKITKPENPGKSGMIFCRWYSDSKFQNVWNFNTKVSANKTLYAKWKKISLKKASISKLQNQSGKKLRITVGKVNDAEGYQIRYSKSSDMKSPKYTSTKNNTVKTLTKLTKGKTYYVQVRAYQKDSTGKNQYGDWSSVKYKKISK